jgi:hypothetical protein
VAVEREIIEREKKRDVKGVNGRKKTRKEESGEEDVGKEDNRKEKD